MSQRGNGSNSQNEMASKNDATCSGGSFSSPAPTHTSVGGKKYRRGDAETNDVLVTLPAPVELAHRRRVQVAVGDGQSYSWFPGGGRLSEKRDA